MRSDNSSRSLNATRAASSDSLDDIPRDISKSLRTIKRKLLLDQVQQQEGEKQDSPRDPELMDELLKSWFKQNVFNEERQEC